MPISRRTFVAKLGSTGLAAAALPHMLSAIHSLTDPSVKRNPKGLTFLFQGDSITDGGRSRNDDWNHVMGHGYAYLIASRLWFDYPGEDLMFYNRGISGNKVKDLADRWQEDTLALKPDVLSILIGVNDVSRIVRNEYTIDTWRETYADMLDRTREALPDTMLVLCEPFVLPSDWDKAKEESWQAVMTEMQSITRLLANTYQALFVALQTPFRLACQKAPATYWVWDGVHPMPAGHELIARLWIQEVGTQLDFIRG